MASSSSANPTLYEQLVRKLYGVNIFLQGNKNELKNILKLYELLDKPLEDIRVFHVAGTNGKGSVCIKIAETLRLAADKAGKELKIGIFSSPHISSFRERIRINGEPISEEAVVKHLSHIFSLCEEHDIPSTYFEIVTALACSYFKENNVDFVVLEVGLGGRLDATNVISKPLVSVITSIGLEHTQILGDTVELIAAEKAGIIKEGVPVVVGPVVPHDVVKRIAKDRNAPYYEANEFNKDAESEQAPQINDYDLENSNTVKAVFKVLFQQYSQVLDEGLVQSLLSNGGEIIEKGIRARPPCRFEKLIVSVDVHNVKSKEVEVILDVSHNAPAMDQLISKLNKVYPGVGMRFVAGLSKDKDVSKCFHILQSSTSTRSIHVVEGFYPGAATLQDIVSGCIEIKQSYNADDGCDRSVKGQVKTALQLAAKYNEMLVICGSFYLMSDARQALGLNEPVDTQYIKDYWKK